MIEFWLAVALMSAVVITTVLLLTGLKTADEDKGARLTLWITAITIPVIALALYLPQGFSLGGSLELQIAKQLQILQSSADPRQRQQQLLTINSQLEQQVSVKHSKPEIVQLHAEIYSANNNHTRAAEVYSALLAREADNAAVMALLAQSLYLRDSSLAQPGVPVAELMSQRVKDLLIQALSVDPQQYLALSMSGMQAFTEARYAQAIMHWRTALAIYGESSPQAVSLNAAIQSAESRLDTSPESLDPSTAFVRLRVSIDPSQLSGSDSPDTAVFVFARASSGSRMPLAARRLRLADLPIDLYLTDNDKMAAQSIAGESEVIVAARLSRSGQPMAATGDSESDELTAPVVTNKADAPMLELLIDRQI